MPVTKVIIVYSLSQKVRRRVILADHDYQYESHKKDSHENEGWLEIPIKTYNEFGISPKDELIGNTIDVHIASILGNPQSDKCAVIGKDGTVLRVINADPVIDSHPDGDLINHPLVTPEWKFVNGEWDKPAEDVVEVKIDPLNTQDTFDLAKLTTSAKYNSFATEWQIQCVGADLTIGCQTHPISEWASFSDAEVGIFAEPNLQTARWWRNNKADIMAFAEEHLNKIGKLAPTSLDSVAS